MVSQQASLLSMAELDEISRVQGQFSPHFLLSILLPGISRVCTYHNLQTGQQGGRHSFFWTEPVEKLFKSLITFPRFWLPSSILPGQILPFLSVIIRNFDSIM